MIALGETVPASKSGASGGPMVCFTSTAVSAAGYQMVQRRACSCAPRQLRGAVGWKTLVARPTRVMGACFTPEALAAMPVTDKINTAAMPSLRIPSA